MKENHVKLIGKLHESGFTNPTFSIQYKGSTFTVVKAIASKQGLIINFVLEAEGISRRSVLDKPDDVRGQQIAGGRALKALVLKAQGVRDLHRRSLLMG